MTKWKAAVCHHKLFYTMTWVDSQSKISEKIDLNYCLFSHPHCLCSISFVFVFLVNQWNVPNKNNCLVSTRYKSYNLCFTIRADALSFHKWDDSSLTSDKSRRALWNTLPIWNFNIKRASLFADQVPWFQSVPYSKFYDLLRCPAEQQHPELSTWAANPRWIFRGEPRDAVVIWSCPALPGGLTPGENQRSTIDDSTDKLTGHTLPKSSTHPWVSTFSVRDFLRILRERTFHGGVAFFKNTVGKSPGGQYTPGWSLPHISLWWFREAVKLKQVCWHSGLQYMLDRSCLNIF